MLPLFLAAEAVMFVLMAGLALAGLLVYPVDRRLRASRIAATAASYLGLEMVAVAGFGVLWLGRPFRPPQKWDGSNAALLRWVLGRMLGAANRYLHFRIELMEPPDDRLFTGVNPTLVLARHGGLGDSFALVWLLMARYARTPRIVLKEVLLWEPLIDVALSRIGACFLPRSPRRAEPLEQRVGRLAAGLGPGDAMLLFPEGGNWTPERHRRAVHRLRRAGHSEAARTAGMMEHVLPPRTGGLLACLESRTDLHLVVVAHTGLDRITTARQVWGSIPFRPAMSVRWWTPPVPPAQLEGLSDWMTTEWAVVDEWIDAQRSLSDPGRGTSGTATTPPSRTARRPTTP